MATLRIKTLIAALALTAAALPAWSQTAVYQDPSRSFEDRAADLVAHMTLAEKISQMQNTAPAIPRLGVPAYDWWNEGLHGVARAGQATVFPQAIGLAATFDTTLMGNVATTISDEARAKYNDFQRRGMHARYEGLTFWSPNINIFRDPRWGRGQETYGEDPFLTSRMGVAFVRGMQGNDPKYRKLDATAKHFAVHSGPESERHRFDVHPSERDLYETYLPAFQALVQEAKVDAVMGAYNRVDGEPAAASQRLLEDILRKDWGFKGYVVSDCDAIEDIYLRHKVVQTAAQAAAMGVKHGDDLNCGTTYSALATAVREGLVSEADIDASVKRLMFSRFRLGMFDPPAMVPWSSLPYSVNQAPQHDQLARRAADESIVLLKNNGLLPLSHNLHRIAVIGPTADDVKALLGNYNGTPAAPVTILQGIRQAMPNAQVTYAQGAELVQGFHQPGTAKPSLDQALDAARKSDVVIFVGGLTSDLEGEEMKVNYPGFAGGDRTDIRLPATQQKLLEALQATGKPVVLVLTTGSALAVDWAKQHIPAIVVAWYPGQRGGNAVADVLFGNTNPAGRLPVTFYKADEKLPAFDDYSMQGRTYRYFKGEPLYPFGYGLSYTQFAYSDLQLDRTSVGDDGHLHITLKVKNSGQRAGDEVVQLYLSAQGEPHARAIKQLRGFQRIHLQAGETGNVSFDITPRNDLKYYDDVQHAYAVDPGHYQVQIGASSADIRLSQDFTVHE
ncbi:MAG TPA: glycoside hydrolase family 3 C-terminal domain-containing protein [Dyella sp.]|uniref:glycoside hydrolase family 3 C-terminal domain-containing protein n=1 Tax=Dyella sp. TaxID=1869338 RepID=UPI002D1DCC01|nr:glycoside hydrolase family 3 C-terminal domain-containing protein [Dyella sp.]HTV84472.1 glycoside hydrolase family 3 C-terminal domain-containing protein [Dyella sp.]